MRSLNLREAAAFLGLHPSTLQERAKRGEIPGAKIGKEWRFLEDDLVAFIKGHYPDNAPQAPHVATGHRRLARSQATRSLAFEEALGLPQKKPSATDVPPPTGQEPQKRSRNKRLPITVISINKPDPKVVAHAFMPLLLDWLRRERAKSNPSPEASPAPDHGSDGDRDNN